MVGAILRVALLNHRTSMVLAPRGRPAKLFPGWTAASDLFVAAQWLISPHGWCFSRSRYLRMTTVARSESLFLSTLPGRYYYDPAIFELGQESIFSSMWVCAGRAESIPAKPGAYQVVTIGKESVIIVRTRDVVLHTFLTVTRHRAAPLCSNTYCHLDRSLP